VKLTNYTPFPSLCFESRRRDDTPFRVIVARMTLDLQGSRALRLSRVQRPLNFTDLHWGEPGCSSVREESDLAPFKPRTDVVVVGTARSLGAVALPAWEVKVRVGQTEKHLRVTGPRWWVRDGEGRFKLTDPEPCTEVPLRYEHALGGPTSAENPLGVGLYDGGSLADKDRVPAPRIESDAAPVREWGKALLPEGFGVYGRAWQPRLAFAGTYDDAWLERTWPRYPEDFNFGYWNGAHPDLVVPYLKGDEEVELVGFHVEGAFRFRLPGHYVFVLLRYGGGFALPHPMWCDTLIIDTEVARVSMVYRLGVPLEPAVSRAEIRMRFNDPDATAELRHG